MVEIYFCILFYSLHGFLLIQFPILLASVHIWTKACSEKFLIKSAMYLCSISLRVVYNTPKSIQASVTILENLHLIIEKTKPEDVTTDIMPMLFCSFDSSTIQVQVSASLGYANHLRHRLGGPKTPRLADWMADSRRVSLGRRKMEMRMEMGWRSWLCNYSSNFLINCDSQTLTQSRKVTEQVKFAYSFRNFGLLGVVEIKIQ